eukprot:1159503-Pelagomonas_calceolata.AAC.4
MQHTAVFINGLNVPFTHGVIICFTHVLAFTHACMLPPSFPGQLCSALLIQWMALLCLFNGWVQCSFPYKCLCLPVLACCLIPVRLIQQPPAVSLALKHSAPRLHVLATFNAQKETRSTPFLSVVCHGCLRVCVSQASSPFTDHQVAAIGYKGYKGLACSRRLWLIGCH